jgi:hypothetical protein
MKDSFSRDEIEKFLQFQKEDFPDLHQAAKEDNILLFLGAGLARMYGCPLWNEMAKELVKKSLASKIISYAERDILSNEVETDPRKVISICYSICSEKDKLNIYEDAISKMLINLDSGNVNKVYNLIFSINPKTYLTTNIDLGIKQFSTSCYSLNRRIYNCTSPNDSETIKKVGFRIFKDGNIIYLHGNCENIRSAILPVERYLEYYADKEGFLQGLFSNIRGFMIFIGYGLKEWDVIERIYKMYKANIKADKEKEWTSCILTPVFTHEITKFKLEKYYYESFGVKPIPYIIDDNGYEELHRVLENLRSTIDKTRPAPYDVFKEIEEEELKYVK